MCAVWHNQPREIARGPPSDEKSASQKSGLGAPVTLEVLVAAVVGPLVTLVLLTVAVGFLVFGRHDDDEDEVRTRPLPRAFVMGAFIGALVLGAGDAVGALIGGMPVLAAALGGAVAGFLSAPILLASLLAGHATILGLTLSFAINAGALSLAVEAIS